RQMGDAWHRRGREAFQRRRRVSHHRASAPARLHVASRLARGSDRESRALRSGRKGRCHDSPLDAFRPDERGRTRTSGLAKYSEVAAATGGAPPPGSREYITLKGTRREDRQKTSYLPPADLRSVAQRGSPIRLN